MPTIIDELVVTLGLDPKDFDKGQKKAASDLLKLKKEAEKQAKEIEAANKRAAESFDNVARKVLGLYAVFTAGRGLKEFTEQLTKADGALGRLSFALNMQTSDLSAWEQAVVRNGGSAEGAASAYQSFSNSIQELKITGNTSILPFLYRLQAESGKVIPLTKGAKEGFLGLSAALSEIAKKDPQRASFYARSVGVGDPAIANLLFQGPQAVAAAMAKSRALGTTNQADATAAQKLLESFLSLTQASEDLGRKIKTDVTPIIVDVIDHMTAWIEKNKDWIEQGIGEKIKEFADWLKSIDWVKVEKGLEDFGKGLKGISVTFSSLVTLGETFFALWLGSKFFAVLANIALLWTALRGGSIAGGGLIGSIFSMLGLGVAAGVAGSTAESTPSNQGEMTQWYKDHPGSDASIFGKIGKFYKRNAPSWAGGDPHGATIADRASGARRTGGKLTANQQEAFAAAIGEGLSPTAARALVANMSGESLANPHDKHWDVSHYSQGIVQWDDKRSEKIKNQFGKYPRDMTVAEQTRAAVWEIRNNPDYHTTNNALQGGDASVMMRALVGNYERPRDVGGQVAARSRIYAGLGGLGSTPANGGSGGPSLADWGKVSAAAARAAQPGSQRLLSPILSSNIPVAGASTSYNSSSSSTVGDIHVHTQATDAAGIAKDIKPAIERNNLASQANYGQQ